MKLEMRQKSARESFEEKIRIAAERFNGLSFYSV